jgi:transcriptional regulator with XRE-family HTH domain
LGTFSKPVITVRGYPVRGVTSGKAGNDRFRVQGPRMARERNTRLEAAIRELGWSQEQLAARFRQVAAETGAQELGAVTRSHINQWIRGSKPGGPAARILCETLSRGLKRPVPPTDIGLADEEFAVARWSADPMTALSELGSLELDKDRRGLLARAAYSVTGLALPAPSWWQSAPQQAGGRRPAHSGTVTAVDVASIREMTEFFSRRDQQRGGGHGRTALVAYLRTDVAACLGRRTDSDRIRRELLAATGELVYLCGWMAFDASEHALAQHYFTLATRLAAEADDPPLAGHILRAMAHQAVDLGHPRQALELAEGSLAAKRYTLAVPREKALLGVVHARALAAAGRKTDAVAALLRAEDDLTNARDSGDEPGRVFFFGEASLAHETACTLRDLGDLKAAEHAFNRSVRTRLKQSYTRTHSVTLGYLGAVQAQQGALEAACATWSRALDTMDGIRSGRARDTVMDMRRTLSPFHGRGIPAVSDLDGRARALLSRIS